MNMEDDNYHEEQRTKDLDIPIFQMEQRLDKLESTVSTFQIDMTGKMSEAVSQKFNNNMQAYLPKVKSLIDEFRLFQTAYKVQ
jgi:uncharacterized coiled-coil protein SlyX